MQTITFDKPVNKQSGRTAHPLLSMVVVRVVGDAWRSDQTQIVSEPHTWTSKRSLEGEQRVAVCTKAGALMNSSISMKLVAGTRRVTPAQPLRVSSHRVLLLPNRLSQLQNARK